MFLSPSQRPSHSTSVFQFPTGGKGADITPMPAMPTVIHDIHTMITITRENTHIADIITKTSTIIMKRMAKSVVSMPILQVRNQKFFIKVSISVK